MQFTSLRFVGAGGSAVALLAGLLVGCGGSTTPPPVTSGTAPGFRGTTLTVACGDPAFAREFGNRARAWAGRTGATVQMETGPINSVAAPDVRLMHPTELGGPASRKELAPVPAALRLGNNPLLWDRILDVYRMNLVAWGDEYVGLPVAGDAYVVVYRADLFADPQHKGAFAARFAQRPLVAPTTWEDFADVAAYFADAQKKPSLPGLPADPARLLALYHQLAACYDRRAIADAERGKGPEQSLGLHFRNDTWQPRLTTPGFVTAAKWLADTKPYRAAEASDDPVAALGTGSAVLAVLTLADVARLPKDPATGGVSSRYRVGPLPGTRSFFDSKGQRQIAPRQANYVPFVGSGGWVGTVSKASPKAEAAWDLLAEAASLTGSSALLSEPTAGVGPFRTEHLDDARDAVWHGYQFDPERSKELANAIRHYVGQNVVNPALPMRGPDAAARTTALEVEIRKAATGQLTAEAALANATESWQKLDATQNPDERTRWRRNELGLP